MRILVFGATGYIGSHLVPALVQSGFTVCAAARRLEVLRARGWEGVELASADALDPGSLDAALSGCDMAYYLVHSMASGREFADLDRRAADNFRLAAERAGIRRIVYLGGLQPPSAASEHLASRKATGERLRAGPIPVTEVRAGVIVGAAGSAAFEVIRDLVYHLPIMVTPRWVQSRTQPIALDDLIEYLVALPTTPGTEGRTFDVCGPETLRYEELIRQFGEAVGKRPLILRLPVMTPRLSSYWLDLVTAVPANVARPLIDGLKHDLLGDDRPIRALLPITLHTYREAVRAALRAERAEPVPGRWTDGALTFRGQRADIAFYAKSARAEQPVNASTDAVWRVVASLGGETGWLYCNGLWRLRGLLDRVVGGPGMRRGRRHPSEVRVGDAVDFWRVAGIEHGRRLTLVAEMLLPGSAVLEFEVIPRSEGGCTLVTTAKFHPAGAPGLLYWYALGPVHWRVFRGLTAGIARRAEMNERGAAPPLRRRRLTSLRAFSDSGHYRQPQRHVRAGLDGKPLVGMGRGWPAVRTDRDHLHAACLRLKRLLRPGDLAHARTSPAFFQQRIAGSESRPPLHHAIPSNLVRWWPSVCSIVDRSLYPRAVSLFPECCFP